MLQHHLRRRRTVTTEGGITLPRTGLLFYARLPNSESAVWDEEAEWEENADWLYYALPVSCYAAVGTGFWFSDATTPIPHTMTEILAWSGINQYHVGASEAKGVWVYDPFTVSEATLNKARRFMKDDRLIDDPEVLSLIPNAHPFTDSKGTERTLYPLQYMELSSNLDLSNASIVGTETVTAKQGTATVTVAAGKLTVGAGTLWSWRLSNGSAYEFGTVLTATTGTCFDTSGNGRNLTFTVADTAVVCKSGREKGSNSLDEKGFYRRENLIHRSEPASAGEVSLKQNITYETASGPFLTLCSNVIRFPASTTTTYIWQAVAQTSEYQEFSFLVKMDDGSAPVVSQSSSAGDFVAMINGSHTGTEIRSITLVSDGIYRIIASREATGSNGYCGAHRYTTNSGKGFVCSRFLCQRTIINREYIKTTGSALNITIPAPTNTVLDFTRTKKLPIIACEGDSRTNEGSPSTTFWPQYLIASWPELEEARIHNFAVGGQILEGMVTQYPTEAGVVAPSTDEYGYFIEYGGANDLGPGVNATGEAVYANKKLLWAAAKASGYLVVASTEAGSSGWTTEQQAEKTALNVLVRSDPSLYDYLIEPDVDPRLGILTNTTYYLDGTHLTDAGSRAFAEMIVSKIAPYFTREYYDNQSSGQSNYNLIRVSGTSPTLTAADTYSFADAHAVRVALGWEYGTDHWAFTDAGVPKVIAGSVIKSHGLGPDLYTGVDGIYLYA